MTQLELYRNIAYRVQIVPEVVDDEIVYVASHPELAGCISHGSSPEEARMNLFEVRDLYISALLDSNQVVPLPTDIPPETGGYGNYEEITWQNLVLEE